MNNYIYIDGKKIEISEETANKLKEKFSDKSPYDFEHNEPCYLLYNNGEIIETEFSKRYDIVNQDNFFKTRQEAEHERDKREAIFKIKKYIYDNFGYDPTDWDSIKYKSFIICSLPESKFYSSPCYEQKYYSPIGYLKTEEQAQEIIDNFEDELKIIFDI